MRGRIAVPVTGLWFNELKTEWRWAKICQARLSSHEVRHFSAERSDSIAKTHPWALFSPSSITSANIFKLFLGETFSAAEKTFSCFICFSHQHSRDSLLKGEEKFFDVNSRCGHISQTTEFSILQTRRPWLSDLQHLARDRIECSRLVFVAYLLCNDLLSASGLIVETFGLYFVYSTPR